MKKILIMLIVAAVVIIAANADDDSFFAALNNCSSYSSSGTSTVEGQKMSYSNKILGWSGDKCVYKETVIYPGLSSCVTCKFTKPQLKELLDVMSAYSLVQKYSGEKVDTSSLSAVQNNAVVKVWNKYLQDSSVCTIDIDKN